ncbi:MAG: hypothetical protein K0U59_12265 [Gammaproteobacteria bacterium]|nr:hypothetical protein [Gammaproteobacteria bacterium]
MELNGTREVYGFSGAGILPRLTQLSPIVNEILSSLQMEQARQLQGESLRYLAKVVNER